MKMFLLKSFCLLALMFISVLAGIQIADNNLNKMKGNSNTLKQPMKTVQSLLISDPSSHDLQLKQHRLEQINSFNIFSFMGKKMSDGIANTSAKIIKSIAN